MGESVSNGGVTSTVIIISHSGGSTMKALTLKSNSGAVIVYDSVIPDNEGGVRLIGTHGSAITTAKGLLCTELLG